MSLVMEVPEMVMGGDPFTEHVPRELPHIDPRSSAHRLLEIARLDKNAVFTRYPIQNQHQRLKSPVFVHI